MVERFETPPEPALVRQRLCLDRLLCTDEIDWYSDGQWLKCRHPLQYLDGHHDDWILDIHINRRIRGKWTVQVRWRDQPIVRLDVRGAPHLDQDDQVIPGTHLQWYTGTARLKWAAPVPSPPFSPLGGEDVADAEYFGTVLTMLRLCRIEYRSFRWLHPEKPPTAVRMFP